MPAAGQSWEETPSRAWRRRRARRISFAGLGPNAPPPLRDLRFAVAARDGWRRRRSRQRSTISAVIFAPRSAKTASIAKFIRNTDLGRSVQAILTREDKMRKTLFLTATLFVSLAAGAASAQPSQAQGGGATAPTSNPPAASDATRPGSMGAGGTSSPGMAGSSSSTSTTASNPAGPSSAGPTSNSGATGTNNR